jgi:hypothetical protein
MKLNKRVAANFLHMGSTQKMLVPSLLPLKLGSLFCEFQDLVGVNRSIGPIRPGFKPQLIFLPDGWSWANVLLSRNLPFFLHKKEIIALLCGNTVKFTNNICQISGTGWLLFCVALDQTTCSMEWS